MREDNPPNTNTGNDVKTRSTQRQDWLTSYQEGVATRI
jgi:hypothetical protein